MRSSHVSKERVTSLLKKTAEITDYPPEVVASVMTHCFDFMKEFMTRPMKAGLRLPYIGVIRPSYRALNYYLLEFGTTLVRNGKLTKERFRIYWELRNLIRKDNERRDYKTRLGWTFNPHWRQGSDSIEGDRDSYDD